MGNLRLGREEDMFLVTEKVDGVVCKEVCKGGIEGGPCVEGIMPERESVAERLAGMAPGDVQSVNRRYVAPL